MRKQRWDLAWLALSLAAFVFSVSGQTVTATLTGSVRDQAGAALAGARVMVTSKATNISREAAVDESGEFTITYL